MNNKPIYGLMKEVPGVFFWQFFLLNLISDYVILGINPPQTAYYLIPGLAALTAWIESLIFKAIVGYRTHGARKVCGYVYYWLLLIVHNTMLVADLFLLWKFNTIFTQQSLDLIFATNAQEAGEFLSSYLSPAAVAGGVIAIIALNFALYWAGRAIANFGRSRLWIHVVKLLLILAGAAAIGYMVYGFVRYRSGAQIPSFTAPTRSFINPAYQADRPRIVLSSIDFDRR